VTPVSGEPTESVDAVEAPATDDPPPRPDVPEPPVTGDAVLDEATGRLAEAAALPLEAQVEAYEHAHRALQDRLADVEG
jgi:hypothetical protein